MTNSLLWGTFPTRLVAIGSVFSAEIVFISPKSACSLRPRSGEWRQISNAGFRTETAAHPFDQNLNAVSCGDQSCDQRLQAFEWALSNLDVLPRHQPLIYLHNFIFAHAGFDFADECIR